MKIERKILVPLRTEQFKIAFNHTSSVEPTEWLLDYYNPIIKLLERTAFNRYFWFIVDFSNWINVDCGGDFENLTGLKKSAFVGKDHSIINNITHPEDLEKVHAFSRTYVQIVENFSQDYVQQLRMSLYFRIKNSKSEFYWIMVQYPVSFLDTNGMIKHGLVFVTDLSHIKLEGTTMMSIFDPSNQQCQQFYCSESNQVRKESMNMSTVTAREREILALISIGFGSKQIADSLCIAVKTVDNHRQNMLRKTNTKSCSELISLAIRLGII